MWLEKDVDRYEEIPEIYGVFPLRENYLEAGNAWLKNKYGVEALVKDNVVRIPFTDRLLFSEDEYDFYGIDEDSEDMKQWRMQVTACISLKGTRLEKTPKKQTWAL